MERILYIFILVSLSVSTSAQIYAEGIISTYIEDESLVFATLKNSPPTTHPDNEVINNIFNKHGVSNIYKALPSATANSRLSKIYCIELSGNEDDFIADLNIKAPAIFTQAEREPRVVMAYEPNDYNRMQNPNWPMNLISAPQAWDITKGSKNIKIAVIDDGFDILHEELKNKIVYTDGDVGHIRHITVTVNGEDTTQDKVFSHGTATATFAAGESNNEKGICGSCINCGLMLYRTGNLPFVYGMFDKMLRAAQDGADIISVSICSTFARKGQAVMNAIADMGCIVVASAGNGRKMEIDLLGDLGPSLPTTGEIIGKGTMKWYPASYDSVISVSSIGIDDCHDYFKNNEDLSHSINESVDICAPGYNLMTARPENQYFVSNGTSFATPIVAGICGLILSINPCLTPNQVDAILKASADDIYCIRANSKYTGQLGAGRINAYEAVKMAMRTNTLNIRSLNTSNTKTYKAFKINAEALTIQNTGSISMNASGKVTIKSLNIKKGGRLKISIDPNKPICP